MDLIGTRIGSYVVERKLGEGGAGAVYACKHTLIDREVAVKVLHDEHVRDPDQVARFFQEAKAAADIGHPNIIVIIDYGTLELPGRGRTYVMMESLDGESLDKRLSRGGMSAADITHVFRQIASALVACHGKGIIHRDLKPSNIFLCNRSFDPLFVKVLDFGTAKLAAPAPDMRRTQYGIVIGTPAYMSPEQCEGKGAVDHRSDIYSLGVMLYEMLTGTLPFEGEIRDILIAHKAIAPQRPRERNPSVPPEWEALCLRMMEKSREARFQSVTQLALALDDLPGHAAAYEAARAERAGSGRARHTLVSGASNDIRETMRVQVDTVVQAEAPGASPASSGYPFAASTGYPASNTPPGSSAYPASSGYFASNAPPGSSGYPDVRSPASLAPAAEPGAFSTIPGVLPPPGAFPTAEPGAYSTVPGVLPPPGGFPAAAANPRPASSMHRVPSSTTSPVGSAVPPGPRAAATSLGSSAFDPNSGCAALIEDPRHAAFARTLMSRPPGRWFEVVELCQTASVAQPATLPVDLTLFVSWLEHPYPDPSLAAVIFLSLRTGWSVVVLCARVR